MIIINKNEYSPDYGNVDQGLVIHQRARVTKNSGLIILVHGIGGSRAGTWLPFARLLYRELSNFDLGLYEYRTLHHRLGRKAVDLKLTGRVLSDVIRELSYSHIILIGHSMGGLLCKSAICNILDTDDTILDKLGALILIATPQLGSLRIPRFFSWFSREFKALRPHSQFVQDTNLIFKNKLSLVLGGEVGDKPVLPTWAIVPDADNWVDPVSAGDGIPTNQTKHIHGTHRFITKPTTEHDSAFSYVISAIHQSLNLSSVALVSQDIERLIKQLATHSLGNGELTGRFTGSRDDGRYSEVHCLDAVGVKLKDSSIMHTRFHDCNLTGTSFKDCFLNRVLFCDSTLINVRFDGGTFDRCAIRNSDLSGCAFNNVKINEIEARTSANGITFNNCVFKGEEVHVRRVLSGADFLMCTFSP